ncbi:MAG: VWA domain-containing protein [Thermoanaerobaculia bacterium]
MTWAAPWAFALLLLPLARVVLRWRDRKERFAAFPISSLTVAGARRGIVTGTAWVPFVLEISGWILLTVALARPQQVTVVSNERYGIDVVVALDSSGSMAAEDFRPRNRFAVAKELIAGFIDGRTADRIGVVTFGSSAVTRVPITFDRNVAREILSKASIGENGDGTAIGHAIAVAVNRLRSSKARSRVIVLVTDGVNNSGSIDPLTAAELASKFGIRIYTIGVGSTGRVPIPIKVQDQITGQIETQYQFIRADLDESMLRKIASMTGAEYFRAVDPRALRLVFARIDQLEKSPLSAPKRRIVEELFHRPLEGGIALIALAIFLGETVWMRLPA